MMHLVLKKLANRRRLGMKPGLDNIKALLSELGNPHNALAAVHIAGTNGKGTVAAVCDEILRAAGYPCGRYTSPHLNLLNERFLLNGTPVSDSELVRCALRVTAAISAVEQRIAGSITFFEAMTALALLLFKEANLKIAVLETGLGGRLDATNVVEPLVSVITKVGLDHCEWLGESVEQIAAEKGGIIKPGRPVVVAANSEPVQAVLAARAMECGSLLLKADEQISINRISGTLDSQRLKISTTVRDLPPVEVPLAAKYHLENIAAALCALEVLHNLGLTVDDSAFKKGLSCVTWPGRFQRMSRNPVVILDGAHNPDAAYALRLSLKQCGIKDNICLVAGFCGEKSTLDFLRCLCPAVRYGFAVKIDNPRALKTTDAAALMRCAGISDVSAESSVGAALGHAVDAARKIDGTVLVTGSLFLVGEVLALFNETNCYGLKLNEGTL
jgi:dihydrofolate synthase / folylpolyglutamate synthase